MQSLLLNPGEFFMFLKFRVRFFCECFLPIFRCKSPKRFIKTTTPRPVSGLPVYTFH